MKKSNLELFKQALNEAWDEKIREEVEACTEEIHTSERHKVAMAAILDGNYEKEEKRSAWKLTRAKIAAILVAAALLLASCAVIYRNEIRDFVEEIFEDFSKVTYSENDAADGKTIEEVYELTYVPEGYVLKKSIVNPTIIRYEFANNNDTIVFEQFVLDYSGFLFDIENGYKLLLSNDNVDIYCKTTDNAYYYLWNNGKYCLRIRSDEQISNAELKHILNGIRVK